MKKIPLAMQDISELEIKAVNDAIRSERLSLGPRLSAFEEAVCNYVGCRYAVAVSSGTAALHIGMIAAGIKQNDEVITTSFSFIASANSILYVGARPVFVDIDPKTWQMDTDKIEEAITQKTKAILAVHIFGQPVQMQPILKIAEKYNLLVLEDSCEAIGAEIDGKKAGTIGKWGCFAFYPNKQITTGEGGMLITNDENIAKIARSLRNQGRGESEKWLSHERLGYNYRLSELQAALGWAQMQRIDYLIRRREEIAKMYIERLKDNPKIVLQEIAPNVKMSWFVFVVRLADEFGIEDRDKLLSMLREEGIQTNPYFAPIHLQNFYREMFGYKEGELPITEHISARSFALPFYTKLTESEIDFVCERLNKLIDKL